MRRPILFFSLFIAVFLAGVFILPLLNIKIDRTRVLTRDTRQFYLDLRPFMNTPFALTCHFFDVGQQYEGLFFGSSRITAVSIEKMNRLTGINWFKFNYPGGHPVQHLSILKAILSEDNSIKHVLVALDDLQLATMPSFYQDDYFRRSYPDSTASWGAWYRWYLFKSLGADERRILDGRVGLKNWDIENAQKWLGRKKSKDILELDPWVRGILGDGIKYATFYQTLAGWAEDSYKGIPAVLASLAQMKELCEQQNIIFTVLYTPRHYKTFYDRNQNEIAQFKERLVRITPFWDFYGLSKFTTINRYWLETSHFLPEVADAMIAKIFQLDKEGGLFGTLVTVDNIGKHNRAVLSSGRRNLVSLLAKDKRIFVSSTLLSNKEFCRLSFSGGRLIQSSSVNVVEPSHATGLDNIVMSLYTDPDTMLLKDFSFPAGHEGVIRFDLTVRDEGIFQVVVENNEGQSVYRYRRKLQKGQNIFFVPIERVPVGQSRRIRFSSQNVSFKEIVVYSVPV